MEPTVSILQVVLSLLLVIGLIGLSAFALKYLSTKQSWFSQAFSQGQQLKILDRQMLDTRTKLVVVDWKGREYLLLLHAAGAQMLDVEEDRKDG